MKFVSTNKSAPGVGLRSALLAGLAPDGGLYIPESMDLLAADAFDQAETLSEVARIVLEGFFAGDELAGALDAICEASLDIDTPVIPIGKDALLLELFHGPTAAFKDYGARFLANTLQRLRGGEGPDLPPLTILVATSGDTGSAVAAAFHRQPGFRVVILYPESGVSSRQAHQLGSFGDNILTLRLPAGFDRCQALVKEAFADEALRAKVPLSSANSISLGRLLPQTTYYAYAALHRFRATSKRLSFIVPTGNLGNAVAALMARRMGLPIHRVLFAANRNATVPDFIESGEYRGRPSVSTLANAMDVGDPSNVARLRFMMAEDEGLLDAVAAISVDDETITERIRDGEARYGQVFCPHTACAVEMLEREKSRGSSEDFCVVATAHPAKFEEIVEPIVRHSLKIPPSLRDMLARPARSEAIEDDYPLLRDRLLRL